MDSTWRKRRQQRAARTPSSEHVTRKPGHSKQLDTIRLHGQLAAVDGE